MYSEHDLRNPVLAAVISNNPQYILNCVKERKDLDQVTTFNVPALQLALYMGEREKICTTLVVGGASMQCTDFSGATALLVAAYCDSSLDDYCDTRSQVYRPARPGADPNARNNVGITALHYAIGNKNLNNCLYLLNHGADWEISCEQYGTAFEYANTLSRHVKGSMMIPILEALQHRHGLKHDNMHLLE
jgi:ankyrin repeat protein